MDLREILKEAYKELFEIRPLSCGGHMSPLFPKVDVIREPGDTLELEGTEKQIEKVVTYNLQPEYNIRNKTRKTPRTQIKKWASRNEYMKHYYATHKEYYKNYYTKNSEKIKKYVKNYLKTTG